MSKVLVDRELLERTAAHLEWDGSEPMTTIQFAQKCDGLADELRRSIAQPAEAEGVEVVATVHIGDPCPETGAHDDLELLPEDCEFYDGECLIRQTDHLAALSAVTAERDRLREENERLKRAAQTNWNEFVDSVGERDQLRAEVEAMRAFVTECAGTAGGMVNGNKLSNRAKELIAAMAAKEGV